MTPAAQTEAGSIVSRLPYGRILTVPRDEISPVVVGRWPLRVLTG